MVVLIHENPPAIGQLQSVSLVTETQLQEEFLCWNTELPTPDKTPHKKPL
jgi:hypothetical protein